MIEVLENGHFQIQVALCFETVPQLQKTSQLLFKNKELKIDLSAVTQVDSAGVALLLYWVRVAKINNQTIHFLHLPKQLLMIAKVSNINHFLESHG